MKGINWKYAFGEILIVIIGISIAFALNNWAENSKNNTQKEQYLTNMIGDVEANKLQLETNLEEIQEKIKSCEKILPILGTDSPQKMSIIGDIFSVAQITNFESKDITYQTLINSGDLKLLDDFELKAAIEEHYSGYKIMLKDYERQETIHKEYLGKYFILNVDYDAFSKGKFGFLDEGLLKNIFRSIQGSLRIKSEATTKGIESCEKLLDELKLSIE